MSEPLDVAQSGAITVITLNEPARRNALSIPMRTALAAALRTAIADEACRAIVLTGAGGVFCAGGDIKAMGEGNPQKWAVRVAIMHDVARLMAGPKPVVAAVEGLAFGAGMSMTALADYSVASAGASFCASFAKVGLTGDTGYLWAVPQRVGLQQAKALMISARVIDAAEALRIGLVDEVAPAGGALAAALAHAERLAAAAPLAVAAMKTILARGPGSLEDVLAMEMDLQVKLMMSADHAGAREAFFAKRAPVFEGR
jgi:2-(1,2-epoxy-1,2-dihydrophenyl)acetyl-CoA isomerase